MCAVGMTIITGLLVGNPIAGTLLHTATFAIGFLMGFQAIAARRVGARSPHGEPRARGRDAELRRHFGAGPRRDDAGAPQLALAVAERDANRDAALLCARDARAHRRDLAHARARRSFDAVNLAVEPGVLTDHERVHREPESARGGHRILSGVHVAVAHNDDSGRALCGGRSGESCEHVAECCGSGP